MGCMTSAQDNKADADLEKKNNGPHVDIDNPASDDAEVMAEDVEKKDSGKLKVVTLQRRRLSVAPTMVGDVDGMRINATLGKKSPRRIPLGPVVKDAGGHNKDEENSIANTHVAVSKKGYVPYNRDKQNQDAFIASKDVKGDSGIAFFGVFDGHGEFGHHVSAYLRENIVKALEKYDLRADPNESIHLAVADICKDLDETQINTAFSGTTAVMGLRIDETLYVANIGDSRCLLGTKEVDPATGDIHIKPYPLSRDQKPDLDDEKKRILEAGGRVNTLPGLPGEDCGPNRVWLADVDIPGLAMSRSIGDKISHTVGVINDPEVKMHEIDSNDVFVMWASDGVWEFLSNEEVAGMIEKKWPDLKSACDDIVEESNNRWFNNESVVDDITMVVLCLNDFK